MTVIVEGLLEGVEGALAPARAAPLRVLARRGRLQVVAHRDARRRAPPRALFGAAVEQLIGDSSLAAELVGGTHVTIYLHPRDYHRVHAPVSGRVERVVAIPGRLLPVNDAALDRNPELFTVNERLVHVQRTDSGPVVTVMVAAFGVGHMTCSYLGTRIHPREVETFECEPPVEIDRGEELGMFHLGSTVVVLTGAGHSPAPSLTHGPTRLGTGMLVRGGVV